MDVNMFLELAASNGLSTVALIAVALYFKKINEDNREDSKIREESYKADNKEREIENRNREDMLIMKLQTINDTNKDLAIMGVKLTDTNEEISKTNALLAKDMKEELCSIDDKLDLIMKSKE